MLFLFLLSLFKLSRSILVQVNGEIPPSFTKRSTGKPDVILVSANAHSFDNIPDLPFQCHYLTNTPPFSLEIEDLSADYDFSISKDFFLKDLLIKYIMKNNFSVILTDGTHDIRAKYKIINGIVNNTGNFYQFRFFENIKLEYFVYSKNSQKIFCQKNVAKSKYNNRINDDQNNGEYNIFDDYNPFCIVCFLLFTFIIYVITRFYIIKMDNIFAQAYPPNGFWILTLKTADDVLDQSDLSNLQKHYIHRLYHYSYQVNELFSGVVRMKRNEQSVVFERITAIPLANGYFFILLFDEDTHLELSSSLELEFESESPLVSPKGPMKLEFVSFRDLYPYNIQFTLSHNAKCAIPLPTSIISAFQPYGQFITNSNLIMNKISEILTKNLFLKANFQETVKMYCEQVKAIHAFFYDQYGSLVCKYNNPEYPEISDEEIAGIESKIDISRSSYYESELLSDHSLCYISIIKEISYSLKCVICFKEFPKNEILKSLGSPIMNLCCVFVYQMSYYTEQRLRFDHFINLMATSKDFIFCEFPSDFSRSYIVKSSIQGIDFSEPKSLFQQELYKNKEDFDYFMSELNKVIQTKGTMKQIVVETNSPNMKWVSVSGSVNFDPILGETILTVIMEEITKIKNQEEELIETLSDVDFAMKALGFHKFTINNGFILENTALSESLGYKKEDNIIDLKDLVYSEDSGKLQLLNQSNKTIFRLSMNNDVKCPVKTDTKNENQNDSMWFSAISNGRCGFIFCVNDLVKVRTQNNISLNQPLSSYLIVWIVHIKNETVKPFMNLPTIWDVLSVDKNCEFSKFINFIDQDNRDTFCTAYSQILRGIKQFWTIELRLLKIGGEYEWYRISIARTDYDNLYCIALNIEEPKTRTDKLFDEFEKNNDLFSMSKIMQWSFEDSSVPLDVEYKAFEPGIKKELAMNWSFVQKYIPKNKREEFTQKMSKTIRHDQYFEMLVSLEFTEEKDYLVFQGKYVPQLSKVIGYYIEVNDLYQKRYNDIMSIQALSQKKKEKNKDASKMNHMYLCMFNDVLGIIDILTSHAKTREQFISLGTATKISSMLKSLFIDPAHYHINLKKSSKDFNILELIESSLQPYYLYSHNNKEKGKFQVKTEGYIFPTIVNSNIYNTSMILFALLSRVISLNYVDIMVNIGWHGKYLEIDVYTKSLHKTGNNPHRSYYHLSHNNNHQNNEDENQTDFPNQNHSESNSNCIQSNIEIEEENLIKDIIIIMKGFKGDPANLSIEEDNKNQVDIYGRRLSLKDNIQKIEQNKHNKKVAANSLSDSESLISHATSYSAIEHSHFSLKAKENTWFSFSIDKKDHCISLSIPMKPVSYAPKMKGLSAVVIISDEYSWIRKQILNELKGMSIKITLLQIHEEEIPLTTNYLFIESNHPKFDIIRVNIDSMNQKPLLFIINTNPIQKSYVNPSISELNSQNINNDFHKYDQRNDRKSVYLESFNDILQESFADILSDDVIIIQPPFVIGQIRKNIIKLSADKSFAGLTNSFKSIVHVDIIKRHVLVVEDNQTNQFVLCKILETLGCSYSVAESGEEAIQLLDKIPFDIVLMDYWLPILDGAATTRIIRKSPKRYASIPIIAISGADCEAECINAGMNAFFKKPVRIHHIKEALTRFNVA
ncbi:hypothetical protein TRFO_17425 [Tritrichomonas foetus]|uniref:Response regulatory domain-containing protein n=1 Tax=Tritrichomonas foetus TaxID=1144522 RepID=A0A1J4KSR3_9EUKA|nr:hypothetical protein TRFO_17425 [Tritrichomonas foetus]|eukprot:OHT12702.1 hypothetical protein TRFO_17425 [Tritrichomonas foetus]